VNEFKVVLTPQAQDDIRHLERSIRERLTDKLRWMAENALLLVHQPLKGEQWAGAYKYRVGAYRIIYTLDVEKQQLKVLTIGHRRDVYKG
jgi:mRNA interferase RelE/StbE